MDEHQAKPREKYSEDETDAEELVQSVLANMRSPGMATLAPGMAPLGEDLSLQRSKTNDPKSRLASLNLERCKSWNLR